MLIKVFSELVLELLGRNSQDFLVDERVVIGTAQTIFGKLLNDKLKQGESITGFYVPYIFDVQTDTVRNQKYITPFPKIMSIGDNDGIAQIGHVQNEYDGFLLLKPSQLSQYSQLEAGQMGGMVAARPEGDKIYLVNIPFTTTQVLVKMIPQMLDLSEEEEMIGGSSELDAIVLDLTLQKFGVKLQMGEDKGNDGQPLKS